jgi:hypothetical protein
MTARPSTLKSDTVRNEGWLSRSFFDCFPGSVESPLTSASTPNDVDF